MVSSSVQFHCQSGHILKVFGYTFQIGVNFKTKVVFETQNSCIVSDMSRGFSSCVFLQLLNREWFDYKHR